MKTLSINNNIVVLNYVVLITEILHLGEDNWTFNLVLTDGTRVRITGASLDEAQAMKNSIRNKIENSV